MNGAMGAVWAPGGRPKLVFDFKVVGDKIVEIELIGDPQRLPTFNLELYPTQPAPYPRQPPAVGCVTGAPVGCPVREPTGTGGGALVGLPSQPLLW